VLLLVIPALAALWTVHTIIFYTWLTAVWPTRNEWIMYALFLTALALTSWGLWEFAHWVAGPRC